MIIDLSNELLYMESSLDLSPKYSFIFGKNGVGKSTLTRVITEQGSSDYDVRTFAGFEDVVDEYSNLNALVLANTSWTDIRDLYLPTDLTISITKVV